MSGASSRLIVALDLPDRGAALRMLDRLAGRAGCFKVGLELFGAFVFGQGDEHPLKRAIFSACVCALLYSRSAARYSGVRLAVMVRLLWATA